MKRLKFWTGLLTLFLSGIIIGACGTWVILEHHALRLFSGRGPEIEKVIMRKLDRELGLSESQRKKVEEIVCRGHQELIELRMRNRPEREQIINRNIASIKAELSVEQQRELDALHEKMKHRRAQREDFLEGGSGASLRRCE